MKEDLDRVIEIIEDVVRNGAEYTCVGKPSQSIGEIEDQISAMMRMGVGNYEKVLTEEEKLMAAFRKMLADKCPGAEMYTVSCNEDGDLNIVPHTRAEMRSDAPDVCCKPSSLVNMGFSPNGVYTSTEGHTFKLEGGGREYVSAGEQLDAPDEGEIEDGFVICRVIGDFRWVKVPVEYFGKEFTFVPPSSLADMGPPPNGVYTSKDDYCFYTVPEPYETVGRPFDVKAGVELMVEGTGVAAQGRVNCRVGATDQWVQVPVEYFGEEFTLDKS